MRRSPAARDPGIRRRIGELLDLGALGLHGLFLAALLVGPLLLLVDTFRVDDAWSLAAWRHAFGDRGRWASLARTTSIVAGTAIPVALLVGLPLAILWFKSGARFVGAGIGLLLFAAAVPVHITGAAWIAVVGAEPLSGSPVAVGTIHGVHAAPFVALVLGVWLRAVPATLEEAALVEGAGVLGTLRRVSLRAAFPGVVVAALVVGLWATTDYSVSDLLLVRTFAEEAYTQFAIHGRLAEPTLVAVPQLAVIGALVALARRHLFASEDISRRGHATRTFPLARWRTPLSLAGLGLAAALALAPAGLLLSRLSEPRELVLQARVFAPELLTSLAAGLGAGVLTGGMAIGLGWIVVRSGAGRRVVVTGLVLLLAMPAPVLAMGWILLLNRPGLPGAVYDSPLMLVLAYAGRFLPVAVAIVLPAIRALPPAWVDAATLEGTSRRGFLLRIVHPLCLPSTLLAVFLVTALSIGELPCSLLVTPPGYQTVGSRFFSLVHYGLDGPAAALAFLSLLSIALPTALVLLLLARVLRREERRGERGHGRGRASGPGRAYRAAESENR